MRMISVNELNIKHKWHFLLFIKHSNHLKEIKKNNKELNELNNDII